MKKGKRIITTLLLPVFTFTMMLTVSPLVSAKEAEPIKVNGNLIKITAQDDFKQGTLTNLVIDDTVGDGAVTLKPGATEGEFISGVYSVKAFQTLVASWNSDTPEGTYVEVFAKAYVDSCAKWTEWLSWGQWSPYIQRASADFRKGSGNLAFVDTDTFTIRGQDGESASKVQFKAVLHSDNASVAPVLRQLAATFSNTVKGKTIKAVYAEKSVKLPSRVLLSTPGYSQMVRDSSISGSICSSTTITTLLNDRGNDLLPEEVALNTYDFQYQGFGNWSFSVATAGAYGYEAYVQYADMDILREELAKGYSVGISVSYTNDKSGSEDAYIEGAPITTSGHLITVRGYETVNGVDYFYVSDSAASSDNTALLRYRADQLDAAWKNRIAYIVHGKEANAGQYAAHRYTAQLREVNGGKNEYQLFANGKQVKLSSDFLNNKTAQTGGGTIACCYNGSVPAKVSKPTVTTTANHEFDYTAVVMEDGNIRLDPDQIFSDINSRTKSITVYVITNAGKIYVAPLTLTGKTVAAAAIKTAVSAAGGKGKADVLIWAAAAGAVAVLAAAGVVFFLKRRRKA